MSIKPLSELPPPSVGQFLAFGAGKGWTSWLGSSHVFLVHRARTAIYKASELVGLAPGTEILVPAYNCGSEIDPFYRSGAAVIPYRVDRLGRIDIGDILERITGKTKAIYVTHYFGFPQHIDQLKRACEDRAIRLIEDCALSLFSKDGEVPVGTQGDISVFSFSKTFCLPDGGALVVNNPSLRPLKWRLAPPPLQPVAKGLLSAIKLSLLGRFLGRGGSMTLSLRQKQYSESQTSALPRHPEMPSDYYFREQLVGRRMSFLSRGMLRPVDPMSIVAQRRLNYSVYLKALGRSQLFFPFLDTLPEGVCPLNFPLVVRNRTNLRSKLLRMGIYSGAWWAGYHKGLPWDRYPDACFLKDSLLTLPVHHGLQEAEVAYVSKALMSLSS